MVTVGVLAGVGFGVALYFKKSSDEGTSTTGASTGTGTSTGIASNTGSGTGNSTKPTAPPTPSEEIEKLLGAGEFADANSKLKEKENFLPPIEYKGLLSKLRDQWLARARTAFDQKQFDSAGKDVKGLLTLSDPGEAVKKLAEDNLQAWLAVANNLTTGPTPQYKEAHTTYQAILACYPKDSRVSQQDQAAGKAWLAVAKKDYDDKKYQTARTDLDGLVASYSEEFAGVTELRRLLKAKKDLLDRQLARCRKDAADEQKWEDAVALADKLPSEFPEESSDAQNLRTQAVQFGLDTTRGEVNKDIDTNKKTADVCDQLDKLAARCQDLDKKYGAKEGGTLKTTLLDKWRKYGEGLTEDDPQSAILVADRLEKYLPKDTSLADLRTSAAKASASNVGYTAALAEVDNISKAAGKGDVENASKSLKQLVDGLDNIKKQQKPKILEKLTQAKTGLLVARHAERKEDAKRFLDELGNAPFDTIPGDLVLARAVLAAREGNFPLFRKELDKAQKAATKPGDADLRDALGFATGQALANDMIDAAALREILDAVRPVEDAAPSSPKPDPLDENYLRLTEGLIRKTWSEQKTADFFKGLYEYCRVARARPGASALVNASYAECRLLGPGIKLGNFTPDDLVEAKKALSEPKADPAESPYIRYVRGLVLQAEDQASEAVKHYEAAFSDAKDKEWRNEVRNGLAAAAYKSAADKETGPERLLTYLSRAKELDPALGKTIGLQIVKAAWDAGKKDTYLDLTDELLKDPEANGVKEPYQMALNNARTHLELGHNENALKRYEAITQWRGEHDKNSSAVDPIAYYKEVIAPALELGEKMVGDNKEQALQMRVAVFYGIKGKLLMDNRHIKTWSLPQEPMREAVKAFDRALELHKPKGPKRAEYVARHGYALLGLPPIDQVALAQDAEEATREDPEQPMGWAIMGQSLYYRAVLAPRVKSEGFAKEAIAAYKTAIEKSEAKAKNEPSQHSPAFLVYCYKTMSTILVLTANYHLDPKSEGERNLVIEDLKAAEDAADKAKALFKDDDNAWLALANAQEDLAWSRLGNLSAEYYPKAEASFKKVISLRGSHPDPQVFLARCYVKWGRDVDSQRAVMFEKARKQLLPLIASHPEANYWMGELSYLDGKKEDAYRYFAMAIKDPVRGQDLLRWTDRVIGDTWESWQPLFAQILPTDPKEYNAEHAGVLLKRCQLMMEKANEKRYFADLQNKNPGVITDLDALVELTKNPEYKRDIYSRAAIARLDWIGEDQKKDEQNKEQQAKYVRKIVEDVVKMLDLSSTFAGRAGWVNVLAAQTKKLAGDGQWPKEKRIRALEKSLEEIDKALPNAEGDDKVNMGKWKSDLQQILDELNR
jgi:hypothetical protein